MCKRAVCWMVLFLVLGSAASVSAKLVAHWKLDDRTGKTALDSTGNGYNGTLLGNATWIVGTIDGALEVTGNGRVDFGSPVGWPAGRSPRSLCGWGRTNSVAAGYRWMAAYGNAGTSQAMFIGMNGRRMIGGGYNSDDVDVPDIWVVGEWEHVGLTYDGTTARLYANGVQVGEAPKNWNLVLNRAFLGEQVNAAGEYWNGAFDDVRLYDHAITLEELPEIMLGKALGVASGAAPAAGATDVPRDVVFAWKPGEFAKTHDVYFGTSFDDVNNASRSDPKGVLVSQDQAAATCDPAGLLTFGQTYYWRVDEVNAPDKPGLYKGEVWSFTAEPYAYPVKPVKATASSSSTALMGPEKTIDGSGLNAVDEHDTSSTRMWVSKKNVSPIWIKYDFDRVYKLYQMWVWNSNQGTEPDIGLGAKDVTVETSLDGTTWTALAGVPEFAQATGEPNYVHNTTVELGGVQAQYVRLTIASNWADGTKQASLSEVRFFYVPLKAFEPTPANGGADVAVDGVLNWRPGREAAKHDVYISADAAAVAASTTPVQTLTAHSLSLASLGLDYGKTYYWKINEVNDAVTPKVQEGDVWSFTTIGYAVVDDFESYDDTCNRIFFAWVDGFGYSASPECGLQGSSGNGTGSIVGNPSAPFAERTIVHGGRQSLIFTFDSGGGKTTSEAVRTFAVPQDWTTNGIKSLSLWFRGVAGNSGQLYVKIDGTKVAYDGDAADIARAVMWQPWNISLSSVGGNLKAVSTVTIGVEGAGAKGTLYFDDIRLYPKAPEFVTPVAPTGGLVARYTFDGNARDSSGKGFDGTVNGTVAYDQGMFGQAVVIRDTRSYVSVAGVGIPAGAARTISGWAKASRLGIAAWTNVFGFIGPGQTNDHFDIEAVGSTATATLGYYGLHRYGWEANIIPIDLEWHHLGATYDGTTASWYGDGRLMGSTGVASADLAAPGPVNMGKRQDNDNFWPGLIDEVRIYNRALSPDEMAGLAGLTKPMHKAP